MFAHPPHGRPQASQPVKLGGHSEVVPLLPIPNRTVKRLSADDSAGSRVKVGHCQAITVKRPTKWWGVFICASDFWALLIDQCLTIHPCRARTDQIAQKLIQPGLELLG